MNAWTTGTNVNFWKIDVMRVLKIGIIVTPCTTYVFWRNPPLKNLTHPVCIARSRSSFASFMAPENPSFIILICDHNFPCTFLLLKKWNPSASFHYIFNLTWVFCFTLKGACLHGGEGPQIGEITCGGSPNLSCTRDQIKMRDYMDRRVTSPTWGPPPPCRQVLRLLFIVFIRHALRFTKIKRVN